MHVCVLAFHRQDIMHTLKSLNATSPVRHGASCLGEDLMERITSLLQVVVHTRWQVVLPLPTIYLQGYLA